MIVSIFISINLTSTSHEHVYIFTLSAWGWLQGQQLYILSIHYPLYSCVQDGDWIDECWISWPKIQLFYQNKLRGKISQAENWPIFDNQLNKWTKTWFRASWSRNSQLKMCLIQWLYRLKNTYRTKKSLVKMGNKLLRKMLPIVTTKWKASLIWILWWINSTSIRFQKRQKVKSILKEKKNNLRTMTLSILLIKLPMTQRTSKNHNKMRRSRSCLSKQRLRKL